jgi:hypothetical protein
VIDGKFRSKPGALVASFPQLLKRADELLGY